MKQNKIGIFGGSFSPVHKGHVAVAEEFIENIGLDRLYVIPTNISPMKNTGNVSGSDRAEMLRIAFSGKDKVIISEIELDRLGTSYTRDTVAQLKEMHPHDELYLLTGDDWIADFDKWKDYRYILDNVTLVVATRSGNDIKPHIDRLYALSGKRPLLLNNNIVCVSSTEFRDMRHKSDLPEGVYEYIEKRGLYGI